MKIALICSDRGPCPPVKGGAIQLLIWKVAPLLAKKHEVTVYSITDSAFPERETIDGVRHVRYEQDQFIENVCRKVREKGFDLIQVYNRPGWIPALREHAPRAKIVLSLHNLVYETIKLEQNLAENAVRITDWIVTVSKFVAEDTVKKFPEASKKIQVLYTGVDLKEYVRSQTKKWKKWRRQIRTPYKIGAKDPVILFVGRLVSEKGCHLVLEAMEEILKTHPKTKLLIVGSKWYADHSTSAYIEKLKELAKPMTDHIIFTSYVSVDEIPHYFAAADLFICASQWKEPLARVHYEAMAAGLPIITTKRGGNHEVISNGKNGIVIKLYKEPTEFAKAAIRLLSDPKISRKMGKIGRGKVERKYNFKRVASDLLSTYKALRARKRDGN